MSLGRISRLFAAQNAAQLVSLLTQLVLPPVFLRSYGVTLYGEWIALSAALGYLSTLNYGVQTYTNMQMTIHYNRGELEECLALQSGGLFVLLVGLAGIGLLSTAVFLLPIHHWLHLTLGLREAQIILFLFALQILAGMLFGLLSGSYMVIGRAHRGAHFANLNVMAVAAVSVVLALLRSPLVWIAAAQLAATALLTGWVYIDFSRLAPQLRPTLRYWRRASLASILRPSGHYALLYSSNILGYQLPVLLIQKLLGPIAVVTFSVTRTIFSMSRRVPSLVTNSIGPEVTLTFGERNTRKMTRLYELSERLVFMLIPPACLGALLFTPLLLVLWLHRGGLYDPALCLLFALATAIQSVKEHKYQFQFSTNQVRELAAMTPVAYGLMLLIAVPLMRWTGLAGMLFAWTGAELAQLLYLLSLNRRLLEETGGAARWSILRLLTVLAAGTAACLWPAFHLAALPRPTQAVVASAGTLLCLVLSYWIFRIDEVRALLWRRLWPGRALADGAPAE